MNCRRRCRAASLKTALDTLAGHAKVGPFIGRQRIGRLLTSIPSPAHIRAVAQTLANNGSGLRGDMKAVVKAVVKAVLMHPEARIINHTSCKPRGPVLRLAACLRAFAHKSDTGNWYVGNTDNPATSLGQTPLRSPSVSNFYRPGYATPGSGANMAGLVAPERQIAHETSAAACVNFMRDNVSAGVGATNGTVNGVVLNRRDIQPGFTAELALATDPVVLVASVATRLAYGGVGTALKTEISNAVGRIAMPALNTAGSNQAAIDTIKRRRVNAARAASRNPQHEPQTAVFSGRPPPVPATRLCHGCAGRRRRAWVACCRSRPSTRSPAASPCTR